MPSTLNPYLSFRDTAAAAMDFYRSIFGGDLISNTFADMHASEDPAEADKIMHSVLETSAGFTLMAADTPNSMELTRGDSISVSLSGDDHDELMGYWTGLSAGATITAPMNTAPWGDRFGMCVDKFGVAWLVNITAATA